MINFEKYLTYFLNIQKLHITATKTNSMTMLLPTVLLLLLEMKASIRVKGQIWQQFVQREQVHSS